MGGVCIQGGWNLGSLPPVGSDPGVLGRPLRCAYRGGWADTWDTMGYGQIKKRAVRILLECVIFLAKFKISDTC